MLPLAERTWNRRRSGSTSMIRGIVAMLLVVSAGQLADAATLYAIGEVGPVTGVPHLARIDQNTGATTVVGPVPVPAAELAAHDGKLYTFDARPLFEGSAFPRGRFVRLDPQTGAALESSVANVLLIGGVGLAVRSDGVVFLSGWDFLDADFGRLFNCGAFDSCNLVGSFQPNMGSLAFDAADVLYGLSEPCCSLGEEFGLYNLTAGQTLIGLTGLSSVPNHHGMAFDPETGTLYAGIHGSLYTLDVATGAATLIGPTGLDPIYGIAFLPNVSEPGTSALMVGVLVLFAWVSLRRPRPCRGARHGRAKLPRSYLTPASACPAHWASVSVQPPPSAR